MKKIRVSTIVLVTLFLLLIPLITMQFTKEVNWNFVDFIVAGVLLIGTGVVCEFANRKVSKKRCRVAICAFILIVFLLIWVELAVGIIGTPIAGH